MSGGAHPKALGRVDEIPYLKNQQRLIFARCGVTDPLSLDDYRRMAGSRPRRALALGPKATIEEVVASGLRGRGGAGFRPGSNGARSPASTPTRNTSSATPTKATAARSPTAC